MTTSPTRTPNTTAPTPRVRLSSHVVVVPLAALAYAIALHWVYTELILDAFTYVGYSYQAATPQILALCWIEVSIVGALLPQRGVKPSDVVLWILFVVVIAPTMLMLPYIGPMSDFEAFTFVSGMGAAFLLAVLVARRKEAAKPLPIRMASTSFAIVIVLFSLIVYLVVAQNAGLSLRLPNLSDVYEVREDYRDALAGSTILGYLLANQANVINPLLISWGIATRRWPLLVIAVIGQLVLFSATGFKSVLFSLLAIPILVFLFRSARPRKLLVFLWGAAGLLVVTAIIDLLQDGLFWSSLFGRRFLFTPARLSGLYFEWYSNNPLSLMANSILSPFIDTAYPYGPARTIAIYATGSPTASLNANMFASGFAEFGWFGLFGVAVVLGLYLRVLDRAAVGVPLLVTAIVVVMPAVTLSNTALHTSVLSHGLLAALLVLAIVPREIFRDAKETSRRNFVPGRSPLTP